MILEALQTLSPWFKSPDMMFRCVSLTWLDLVFLTLHITKPVFIFVHFLFIISSSTFFICLGTMLCKVWSFFTMELPTFLSIQWQTTLPACHIIHMLALLSKSVCTLAARGMSSSSSLSSQPLASSLCCISALGIMSCNRLWEGSLFWMLSSAGNSFLRYWAGETS